MWPGPGIRSTALAEGPRGAWASRFSLFVVRPFGSDAALGVRHGIRFLRSLVVKSGSGGSNGNGTGTQPCFILNERTESFPVSPSNAPTHQSDDGAPRSQAGFYAGSRCREDRVGPGRRRRLERKHFRPLESRPDGSFQTTPFLPAEESRRNRRLSLCHVYRVPRLSGPHRRRWREGGTERTRDTRGSSGSNPPVFINPRGRTAIFPRGRLAR